MTDYQRERSFWTRADIADASAQLDIAASMPASCAREHGDYSEGDYSVAVATQNAPDISESTFSQVLRERSAI